eukprot:jgi/Ulvmu1/7693/UM038_0125.1
MDIAQWFRIVDEDGSGNIDATELQRALGMGNLHFSLQVVASMIRMYDRDRNGTISYQEFQGLHQFLMDMHASFHQFDLDRSGSLEKNEVLRALRQSGFNLDEHAFNSVFFAFDPDRSNSMKQPEYIAVCVFLRNTAAIFQAFDTAKAGRVALDYNQFVYAASNCK